MIELRDAQLFVALVEAGSLSAASRSLGVPKSTLSRRLSLLENQLGVTLISRDPRNYVITEAGDPFFEAASCLLESSRSIHAMFRGGMSTRGAAVRVTTPVAMSELLVSSVLPTFLSENPNINISLTESNEFLDIVKHGFDFAIRAHSSALPDSSLIRKSICTVEWGLFAGPGYLSRKGHPASPGELDGHDFIYFKQAQKPEWILTNSVDDAVKYSFSPRLSSHNMLVIRSLAIQGMGIASLPRYSVAEAVKNGLLTRVLEGWTSEKAKVTALYPNKEALSVAARRFLEHLSSNLVRATADDAHR